MADFVFDYAKGRVTEKIADATTNVGVMVLKVAESDATLKTRTDLANILASGNTEADFTNYGRKTGLTGTVTVDTSGHTASVSVPNQTWTAAGGTTNNSLVKVIVYYQDSAADSGRIPLTAHDFAVTTDGSDLTVQFNAAGFYRAS